MDTHNKLITQTAAAASTPRVGFYFNSWLFAIPRLSGSGSRRNGTNICGSLLLFMVAHHSLALCMNHFKLYGCTCFSSFVDWIDDLVEEKVSFGNVDYRTVITSPFSISAFVTIAAE